MKRSRQHLALLFVVFALLLSGCDWAQFHFDVGHEGFNPGETTISPSTVGGLVTKWSRATGGAVESSPIVVAGRVYVGSDDDRVYALDLETGTVLWTFTTGGAVRGSPAFAGGLVFVGSDDHVLYALDAQTGLRRWSATLDTGFGGLTATPTIGGTTVYVVSQGARVYAFDALTGATDWSATIPLASSRLTGAGFGNGSVYVGDFAGRALDAFDASTGTLRWRAEAPPGGNFAASCVGELAITPTVAGNRVLFAVCAETHGSFDPLLVAFDGTTGAPQWTADASPDGFGFSAVPAVANGAVYVPIIQITGGSVVTGALARLDLATGTRAWAVTTEGPLLSSPAVANGVVTIGDGTPPGLCSAPLSCAGTSVFAFAAATGAVLWSSPTGGAVTSSPAIAAGTLVVGSNGGKVFAYAPSP